MKIEVIDKNEKPFPKLMVYSCKRGKTIVLVHAHEGTEFHGTCVYTTHSENKVGEVSECWDELIDFEGSITLSND